MIEIHQKIYTIDRVIVIATSQNGDVYRQFNTEEECDRFIEEIGKICPSLSKRFERVNLTETLQAELVERLREERSP